MYAMLKILKASAGSGKTYNLAREYIRLVVTSDKADAYRHVLAVTFTNKATDEMKRRILKELAQLASKPEDSPYYQYFVPKILDAGILQKLIHRLAELPEIAGSAAGTDADTADPTGVGRLRALIEGVADAPRIIHQHRLEGGGADVDPQIELFHIQKSVFAGINSDLWNIHHNSPFFNGENAECVEEDARSRARARFCFALRRGLARGRGAAAAIKRRAEAENTGNTLRILGIL